MTLKCQVTGFESGVMHKSRAWPHLYYRICTDGRAVKIFRLGSGLLAAPRI